MEYEEKFDKVAPDRIGCDGSGAGGSEASVGEELKKAIRLGQTEYETFHAAQRSEKTGRDSAGSLVWQKAVAIEKVRLYIPGGTAPLFFHQLMLAVPARIAGWGDRVFCTPRAKMESTPAVLFAAKVAGVNRIFKAGGVQAIAAMAYGTESDAKEVYKIFGPQSIRNGCQTVGELAWSGY